MVKPHWGHQLKTLKLLKRSPIVFDASDPGTGKTRSSVEAYASRSGKCALIVAPKTLLDTAWSDDINEYAEDMEYSICKAGTREEDFKRKADIYITNTDAVGWLAQQNKKFFGKFDTIIVDEISSFKHRTSQRSKALNKIKKYFHYRQGLTGTPNPKSVTDIWNQIFFLDDGERLGTEFFKFRAAVCTPVQVGPGRNMLEWRDKPAAEEAVAKLISDISVRHQFDECMDIPPNTIHTIKYKMSPKQTKLYKKLEDFAIVQCDSGEVVSAVNAAVLANKLLQLASGAVYADGEPQLIDTGRYQLIGDLIEQRKHSVVFFIWRHQKEQLELVLQKRGISYAIIDGTVPNAKRKEIVRAYQAGFYQTILLHPKTGAHGLTLTRGTSTIWASPIYEPDFLKQGIHRIFRGGQTQRTETIMIEAENTIEGHVFNSLNSKNNRMVNLLKILKEQTD